MAKPSHTEICKISHCPSGVFRKVESSQEAKLDSSLQVKVGNL